LSALSDLGKAAVKDAYEALKGVIRMKFGEKSDLC
jgi:hypothetical protein